MKKKIEGLIKLYEIQEARNRDDFINVKDVFMKGLAGGYEGCYKGVIEDLKELLEGDE